MAAQVPPDSLRTSGPGSLLCGFGLLTWASLRRKVRRLSARYFGIIQRSLARGDFARNCRLMLTMSILFKTGDEAESLSSVLTILA